jgi:hypothetical protein
MGHKPGISTREVLPSYDKASAEISRLIAEKPLKAKL